MALTAFVYNVNHSQFKMIYTGIVFIFLILKNLSVSMEYVICLEDVTLCKPVCVAIGKMGCLTCTCRADITQDTYDVPWQKSEPLEHEELPNPFRMDSQPPELSHFRVQWQPSAQLEHQVLPDLFRMDSQPPELSHFRIQWQQSEPLEHQELPNIFRMDSQPPELSHFRADFNPAFAYNSPNFSPPNNGPVNPYKNYNIFKRSIDKVKRGSPCKPDFPGFCPQSCLTTDYNGCIVCNCTGTIANGNNNNGSSQINIYAGVSGNGLNMPLTLKPGTMGNPLAISNPNVANGTGNAQMIPDIGIGNVGIGGNLNKSVSVATSAGSNTNNLNPAFNGPSNPFLSPYGHGSAANQAPGIFSIFGPMLASGPSQNPSNPANFVNMGVGNVALVFNPTNALNVNPAMPVGPGPSVP